MLTSYCNGVSRCRSSALSNFSMKRHGPRSRLRLWLGVMTKAHVQVLRNSKPIKVLVEHLANAPRGIPTIGHSLRSVIWTCATNQSAAADCRHPRSPWRHSRPMGSHLPKRDFTPGGAVPLLAPLRGHLLPRGARAVEPDGPSILRVFPRTAVGRPHRRVRGPRPPSAVSFRAVVSMGGTSRLRRSPSCVQGFRRLRSRRPVDRTVPRNDPVFDRTHRRVPARGAPGKNLFAHERRRVIGDWEFSAGRVDRGGTVRIGSIVIDCDDFPRVMALWKEALHYFPKYSSHGGW